MLHVTCSDMHGRKPFPETKMNVALMVHILMEAYGSLDAGAVETSSWHMYCEKFTAIMHHS